MSKFESILWLTLGLGCLAFMYAGCREIESGSRQRAEQESKLELACVASGADLIGGHCIRRAK